MAVQRHTFKQMLQALGLVVSVCLSTPVFATEPAAALAVNVLPTGGQVAAGQAAISQSGATMTVNQSSQRAVVNWDSYNVGSQAKVNYQQPNSQAVILNRVTSAGVSQIDGAINANGRVIISNANGVIFGKGAEVNAGAVVATTMNQSDADFMAGSNTFTGNGKGKVVNQGRIHVTDAKGYVALLAPEVRNQGVILATVSASNAVVAAAGQKVTLNFKGNSLIGVTVDKAALDALIVNKRAIEVGGGIIALAAGSADQLTRSVIQNTGRISASSISGSGGNVELLAATVTNTGTISANANGPVGNGGTVTIVANNVTLGTTSDIQANAKTNGNGGSIQIWANEKANVAGHLSATGGAVSGNGGFIDTSAKQLVTLDPALKVDTSAKNGRYGQWTIDPLQLTVDAPSAALISSALRTTNVTLDATGSACVGGLANCQSTQTPLVNFLAGADITSSNPRTVLQVLATGGAINVDNHIQAGQVVMEAATISVRGSIGTTGGAGSAIVLLGGQINILGGLGSNGQTTWASSSANVTGSNRRRRRDADGGLGSDDALYTSQGGSILIASKGDILIGSQATLTANGLDGGVITIVSQSGTVTQQGVVDAVGTQGQGGQVILAGQVATVLSGALMSVDGANAGGSLQIGIAQNVGSGNTLAPPAIGLSLAYFDHQVFSIASRLTTLDSQTSLTANASHRNTAANSALHTAGQILIFGQDALATAAMVQANADHGGRITLIAAGDLLDIGYIQTNGGAGLGGTVLISGARSTQLQGAYIEANGFIQGGTIKVGNDATDGSLPFSVHTFIDAHSRISALSLNPIASQGQGGYVETSGQTLTQLASINVGRGGMWLIDPTDIVIDSALATSINAALNANTSVSILTSGCTGVSCNTSVVSSGNGNIYVNSAISATTGTGNLIFTPTAGTGAVYLSANITTKGTQTYNGDVVVNGAITLTSSAGNADITITGSVSSGYYQILQLGTTNSTSTPATGSYWVSVNGAAATSSASLSGSTSIGSGTLSYDGSAFTYTPTGTFTNGNYLLVGGGGGGGSNWGGGGGAGGLLSGTTSGTALAWTVTVGAGGAGAVTDPTSGSNGGATSVVFSGGATLNAVGGGGGGANLTPSTAQSGQSGGSGGGAGGAVAGPSGGQGTAGQGNDGGGVGANGFGAGGGGGSGGLGQAGTSGGTGGAGGAGTSSSITGTSVNYAAGGGGGGEVGGAAGGTGAAAGGPAFTRGSDATGFGSGGGGGGSNSALGGDGASGTAIFSGRMVTSTGTLAIISGSGKLAMSGSTVQLGSLSVTSSHASSHISAGLLGTSTLTYVGGSGTLTLGAANSHSGGTTVTSGTLILDNDGALGLGTVRVSSGGALDLNGKSISGTGGLNLNGSGVSLSGALMNSSVNEASYADLITLGGATSIRGDTGTIAITNAGSITGAFDLTLGGAQGGSLASIVATSSGKLNKQDGGTWTLSGTNSYTGITTISGGILAISTDRNLGAVPGSSTAASITLSGGTLQAIGLTGETSANVVALHSNRGITLTTDGSGLAATTTTTAGTTYVNQLKVAKGIIGAYSLSINGASQGGVVVLNGDNTYGHSSKTTSIVAGELQLAGTATLSTTQKIDIATGAVLRDSSSATIVLTGVVSGGGSIVKDISSSTLTFNNTAANTFSGGLTVAAGDVYLGHSQSAGSGTITLGDSASGSNAVTLNAFNANTNIANPIVLNPYGSITFGQVSSQSVGYAVTFSGGITGSNNFTLRSVGAGSSTLTFSTNAINNAGTITQIGTGTAMPSISAPIGSNVTGIIQGNTASTLAVSGAITVGAGGLAFTKNSGSTFAISVTSNIAGVGNLILNNNSNTADGITFPSGLVNIVGTIINSGTGTGNTLITANVGSNVSSIIQASSTSVLKVNGALAISSAINPGGVSLVNNASGAVLQLAGGVTGTGDLILNNNGTTANGIYLLTAGVDITGTVTNSGTGSGSTKIDSSLSANVTSLIENSATSSMTATGLLYINANGTTLVNNNASGSAVLTYTGTSTGTGNLTINNNSAIANGVTLSGPLAHSGLLINSGSGSGSTTISNTIGLSSSGVTQNSATSMLVLSATNSYTTPTQILAGVLSISATNNLGGATSAAGNLIIDGGTLRYTGSATFNFNRLFTIGANGATLDASGTGLFNLTTTGTPVLSGSADVTLTLTGNGDGGGSLAALLANPTSGMMHVTKTGTSTWTLSGSSTYTGITTLNGGVLAVTTLADGGTNSGIGKSSNAASNLVFNGGTLRYTGSLAASTDRLFTVGPNGAGIDNSGTLALTWNGNGTGTANTPTFSGASGTLTLGGSRVAANLFAPVWMDAAGAGSSALTKTGAGSWRLTAANSYTGATEVANGTLQLGTATALGASSGVTVSAGGALDLYGQNVATVIPLTLNGSGVSNAGALTNSSSTGATYAGLVDLGSASSVVGVLGTIDLSNAGAITGAYELTLGGKGGSVSSVISTSGLRLRTLSTISQVVAPASPGIWTLLAANTYTGTTTLHTGTLRLGVANAIPSSSAVTVGDSGILDVAGTSIANPISMSSVGYVFNSSAGTNSVLSGQISTANGNGTLAAIAGATITIPADGVGTRGAGLLSIGTSQLAGYSGTVVFAGSNNSHSGTTYVNASATLFLGDADALTNVGRVQMANSGIVDLNGFSTAKTLELERDGVIANKAFGTNSVLTGGILILTSNNTTNLVAVSGATITVRTTGITTSGNGSLTIGGAAYTGTVVLETNNSHVGGTRVVGGKVVLGVDPAVYTTLFPATGSFSVNSGGTLDLMGYTVTSPLAVSGGNLTTSIGNAVVMTGVLMMNGSGTNTLSAAPGATLTINSNIQGSYRPSFGDAVNTGTVTLTGNNNYGTSGTTASVIAAGTTVVLGSANALTAGSYAPISVSAGGVLELNGQNLGTTSTLTLNGTGINGGGALINSSTTGATYKGGLALAGSATIMADIGAITLSSGVQITGTGFGLTLAGSQGGTLSGSLYTSTGGSLTKNGSGTWALGGTDSTYTGATQINGGTLSVTYLANGGTGSSIGKSTNAASNLVINGGTLRFTGGAAGSTNRLFTVGAGGATIESSGTGAITWSGNGVGAANAIVMTADTSPTLTLTGTYTGGNNTFTPIWANAANSGVSTLTKAGPGTWALGSANTYTGVTTISGGTLLVSALGNGGAAASSIGSSSNAASNLVITGGTLMYNGATTSTDRLFTVGAGGATIDNSGSGALTWNGNGSGAANAITVNDGSSPTLTLKGSYSTVANIFAPIWGDAVTTGMSSLTKTGLGIWQLNGTNTYSGPTQILMGGLWVSSLADGGVASSIGMSSNAASNLLLDGSARLAYLGSATSTDRLLTVQGTATLDNSGTGRLAFTNTGAWVVNASAAATLTLQGPGDSSLAASLPNGAGAGVLSLTKAGSGTWALEGTSTYTGIVTVSAGTLSVSAVADGGVASALGQSSNAATNLVLATNSKFKYTGGTGSTDRLFSIQGNATLDASGLGPLTFSNALSLVSTAGNNSTLTLTGTGEATFNPLIPNNGANLLNVTKTGVGSWTLAGANTYTGVTNISAGVLSATTLANGGVASGIGKASSSSGNLVLDGGTLRYTGDTVSIDRFFTISTNGATLDMSGTGGVTWAGNGGTTAVTLASSSGTYSLTLTGSGVNEFKIRLNNPSSSGTVGLTKTGTGTWKLNALNGYTGATAVNAGVLQVGSTSIFAAGTTVTVNSLGTLDLANFALAKAITLNGGAVINSTGNSGALTSGITLTANSTLAAATGATLTISGTKISGAFGLSIGSGSNLGKVVLSDKAVTDSSSYSGSTTVISGVTLGLKYDGTPSFNSSYAGAGAVIIEPVTAGGTLALGGTLSTLNLPVSLFAPGGKFADGLDSITLGTTTSGHMTVTGTAAFMDSVTLLTGGNLTINSGASVTTSQANGQLVLASTGHFLNLAGASALQATDASSRWIVYTANPTSANYGASGTLMSGQKAVWGSTYSSLAPSAVPAGNRYVFANGGTVTVTTTDAIMTYGIPIDLSAKYTISNPSLLAAPSGGPFVMNGLSDIFSVTPTIDSVGNTAIANVGQYDITASGAVGTTGFGTITYTNTGKLTVKPAVVTLGVTGTKTYDGSKVFAVDRLQVNGLANGDTLATATANSSQVSANGSNYFESFTLSSGTASNYELVVGYDASTNAAIITPLGLTATISTAGHTYAGTVTPGTVTFTNKVVTDVVTASAVSIVSPSYSASNKLRAGSYRQSITSTLGGADAGNYTLVGGYTTATSNYTVDPLALTAAITSGSNTYGSAVTLGTASFSNVVGSDVVTPSAVAVASPSYSTSNNLAAGSYKQSITATLGGADAGNYSLVGGYTTATNNYTVNPLALTGSIASSTTTYGDTLVPGAVSLGNVVGADVVTPTASVSTTGNTSTSGKLRAGSYIGGQYISALGGADGGNYTYAGVVGDYTVDPLALNAAIASGSNTYGSAVTLGTASFSNVVGSDDVTPSAVSLVSPSYSTSNNLAAGSYKQTITSTLGGTDAGNYTLNNGFTTATNNYTVNPLALTGSIASSTTTYGDTLAPGAVSLGNVVGADVVTPTASVSTTGNTSTSGKLRAGSYTGGQYISALAGTDAGNYTYAGVVGDYTVDPRALNAAIAAGSNTYGSAVTLGTASFSNVVGSDVVTPSAVDVVSPSYSSSGNLAAGSYKQTITSTLGGTDAGNYTLSNGFTTATSNYTVNPLALIGSIASATSTYGEALVTGSVSFDNVVSGDVVSATNVIVDTTGRTSTSDKLRVGTYIGAQFIVGLEDADARNYTSANVVGNYTVVPLALNASIASGSNTYGSAVTAGAVSFSNVVGSDVVSSSAVAVVSPSTSTSGHLRAGSYKQSITATLGGDDASNYTLVGGFTTATTNYTVNKLALTGSIASSTTTYGDALVPGAVNLANVKGADVVTPTASVRTTGNTSSSGRLRAGSHTGIQFISALSGTDAGNYTYAGVVGDYTVDKLALNADIASGSNIYGSPITLGTNDSGGGGISGPSAGNPSGNYYPDADITSGVASFGNVVLGDLVKSSGVLLDSPRFSTSGNLAVGSYKLSVSSSLSGPDAGNYTLVGGFTTPTSIYTVYPLPLIADIAPGSNTYGSAVTPGTASFSNVVGIDVLTPSAVSIVSPSYSTSNNLAAGSYQQSITSTLGGDDAGNYTLVGGYTTTSNNYTVDPLALNAAIASGSSTYGSAVTPGTVSFSNLMGSDVVTSSVVSIDSPSYSTSSKLRAGSYKQTITSTLGGTDAGNYTLDGGFTTGTNNYTVNPLALTGSIASSTTTYGDTLVPGAISLGNVVGADVVTPTASVSTTGNTSTSGKLRAGSYIGGQCLSALAGTDAGNYTYAGVVGDYTVDPLALNAAISSGSNTYGSAVTLGTASFSNVVGSDVVTPSAVAVESASYSTSNNLAAGSYKQRITSTLGGTDAGNYTLVGGYTTATNTYTVDPLALNAAIAAGSNTYGSAVTLGTASFSNVVGSDVVTPSAVAVESASYSTSNNLAAGSYKQTITSTLGGTDAGNYTLNNGFTTATNNYTVNPLALNAAIASGSNTYGSAVTLGTTSFSNVVGSDVVTSSAVSLVSPSYSTSNNLAAGSYKQTITSTLGGTDAGNYTLNNGFTTATNNYTVNPLALTGSIASSTTTYGDTLVSGAVSLGNVVGADVVTPTTSVSTTGNTSTSGKLRAGSYTGGQYILALVGTDAGNYTYAGVVGDYTVDPLALNAAIAAGSNTYGSAVTLGTASFSNVVGSDVVTPSSVSLISPSYSTSNNLAAGSYKQSITATLGGADAGNYTLNNGFTTAANNYTVNPLALNAAIASGSNTYGSAVTLGTASFSNVVGSDVVTPSAVSLVSSSYSTSNNLAAGSYKQSITATLGGADAGNYTLNNGFTTATDNYTVNLLALNAAIASGSNTYGSAVALGTASFSNVVGSDVVTPSAVSLVSPSYSTSNNLATGSYKQRITSNLGGTDAGNYTLNNGFTTATNNYTVNPLALTGSIASSTTTYGDTLVSGALSLGNVVGADVVTPTTSVSTTGNTSTSGKLRAGSYTGGQYISALVGTDAGNYTYAGVVGDYTVDPLALNAAIASGSNTYGSAVTLGTASFSNVVGSDVVTASAVDVVSPSYSSSGNLVAGSYKQTITSALGGVDAGNYTLNNGFATATNNYTVNPLALNAAIASGSNTYGSVVTLGTASFSNVVGSDVVTPSAVSLVSPSYSTSNNLAAGAYKQTITATLGGTDAGNYTLNNGFTTATNTYTVDPLALTAAITSGNNTYGSAVTLGTASFSNVVGSDVVTPSAVSLVSSSYSTSNNLAAGSYKQTITSTLGGTDAGNYTLDSGYTTGTNNYTVNPLALTGSIASSTTTYGDTLVPGAVSLANVVGSDVVTPTASVSTTGNTSTSGKLRAGSYMGGQYISALVGTDAGNYTYAGVVGDYTVDPLALNAAIASGSNTYGSAVTLGTASFSNVVGSDVVTPSSVSLISPSYSTSNNLAAGSYKQSITAALGGADAGNYTLNNGFTTATNTYTVDPLALNAAIASGSNTYGSAVTLGTASFSNVVGSDVVTPSAVAVESASYSTSNNLAAGSYKQSIMSTLGGTDAGNYTLNSGFTTATNNYRVDPLALNAAIASGNNTYGSAVTLGTASFSNVVGSDVVTPSAVSLVSPSYSTSNNLAAGSYKQSITSTLGGTDAGNYTLIGGYTTSGNTYVVSPMTVSVTGQFASNKIYDAGFDAVINSSGASLVGVLVGDDVTLHTGNVIGTFASADAANGIAVTVTGNVMRGAAAANYAMSQPSGLVANITPAPLTVTANASVKFVTQDDPAGYNGASFSGFLRGQDMSSLSGSLMITRTNSADNGAATYAGVLRPSGLSSMNYAITFVNGNFTVIPAGTLAIQVSNTSSIYGAAASYSAPQVQYLNQSNVLMTLYQTGHNGDTYFYSDGVGGAVTFTLGALGRSSDSGSLVVGNYSITGQNFSKVGNNFNGAPVYTGVLTVNQQAVNVVSDAIKVYDGTTATTGLVLGLGSVRTGDQVVVSGTGAYNSADVGANLSYQVSNLRLAGTDGGNYYLSSSTLSASNGVITPATLTYVATPTSSVIGLAPMVNAGLVTGFVAGDTLQNATTGTVLFSTTATSASGLGRYAITGSGLVANRGNYVFEQAVGNATALTVVEVPLSSRSSGVVFNCVLANDEPEFWVSSSGLQRQEARYTMCAANPR